MNIWTEVQAGLNRAIDENTKAMLALRDTLKALNGNKAPGAALARECLRTLEIKASHQDTELRAALLTVNAELTAEWKGGQ